MKITFLTQDKKLDKASRIIVDTIKKTGHKPAVLNIKETSGKIFARKIAATELFVAQLESSNFGLGYKIAYISQKRKFVLCFYPESMRQKFNPENFVGTKYAKYLKFVSYKNSNLADLVKKNLSYPRNSAMRRFNFFVPRDLDNYLDWMSTEGDKEKSEFVRSLIYDALSKDKSYGVYLKKPKISKSRPKIGGQISKSRSKK